MGFEINKIIVAVLVTILVVFGIGKISDLIFKTEKNVVAYKVEVSTEIQQRLQQKQKDRWTYQFY